MAVCVVKGGEGIAVNVEYGTHGIMSDKGNHYLGAGTSAACDMSRELLYIGYYLCSGFGPCRATYTAPLTDAVAGYISLEWAKDELLAAYEVKTYPKPAESLP